MMNRKPYKKSYERAVKKSVSMPEILFDDAERRRRELRLSTTSDYFQYLVRRDTQPPAAPLPQAA